MSETIVTGVFDLGRGDIDGPFVRPFSYYRESFVELLRTPQPLIVYIQKRYENLVREQRDPATTAIRTIELEDIERFRYFERIQEIRTSEHWVNQAGWLRDSPQYRLPHYVPLMMMRLGWLHEAALGNPFGTERVYWLDGGILYNWRYKSFGRKVIAGRIPGRKFLLYSYPCGRSLEIHGFDRKACAAFCGVRHIRWVCRGGLCGGPLEYVREAGGRLAEIMRKTLDAGYMGTDESLLTILAHRHGELISRRMILRDRLSFLGPAYARLRKMAGRETGLPSPLRRSAR